MKHQKIHIFLRLISGLWEVQDKEKSKKIKIWNNRYVVIYKSKEEVSSPHDLLQGEWYKHGQQLHIAWENGSYSIIDNRNEKQRKLFDFAQDPSLMKK